MTEQPPKIRLPLPSEQEVEAFRELCERVFGPGWIHRLGAFAGVADRTARRWAVGEQAVPPGVRAEIEAQAQKLRETAFGGRLRELVEEVLAQGLSPHIVAGYARDLAAALRPEQKSED